MSNTAHKQNVLSHFFGNLRQHLDVAEPEPRPIVEQLLYSVCRQGVTREQADKAFKALQTMFFDWNEIRVSSVREVQAAFAGLPDRENRATRVITLLQEVFETTFSFDLESLHKKGLAQAEKQLERFQGADRYVVASTLQLGLGGHALPLDDDAQRTLQRLKLVDEESNGEGALEHLVPKARGPLFCELASELAHRYCHEESPTCSRCPMNELCPTGQKNLKQGRSTSRAPVAAKVGARSRRP